jgi:hypothetical protein
MTSAAARVSPGGFGDDACTNAWRKEMCEGLSDSMTCKSSDAFMIANLRTMGSS